MTCPRARAGSQQPCECHGASPLQVPSRYDTMQPLGKIQKLFTTTITITMYTHETIHFPYPVSLVKENEIINNTNENKEHVRIRGVFAQAMWLRVLCNADRGYNNVNSANPHQVRSSILVSNLRTYFRFDIYGSRTKSQWTKTHRTISKRTKSQEDKNPGGQNPRGTKAQEDKIPGGQKPRGTTSK